MGILDGGEYFHGVLEAHEVMEMCRANGDFVVREGNSKDGLEILLSVRWGGSIKNIPIQLDENGMWRTRQANAFKTVAELVGHYLGSGGPVVGSVIQLKRAVGRQSWELAEAEIDWEKSKKLGSGCFGQVFAAHARGRPVAIKTCEEGSSPAQKAEFLREGKMLRLAKHPFIVELIGISALEPPIKMVMEMVDGGDLFHFLRDVETGKRTRPKPKQLLKFVLDTAKGFEHLAFKNILHLDVATRNCLVKTEKDKSFRSLISDFGLSRFGPKYKIQDGDAISPRWAPPELLRSGLMVATPKSDVWSFGVLAWEIYTDAKTPFSHVSETQNLIICLEQGERETIPPSCPQQLSKLLQKCWMLSPEERPQFKTIRPEIQKIYETF